MADGSPDWRNVRIKDEPVSDYEGGRTRGGSRSAGYSGRGERIDRNTGDERRNRGGRYTPSPPAIHSKYKTSNARSSRSRSRSRSPGRDRKKSRRSHSRDRIRESYNDERRRPRSRSRDRERERGDRQDTRRIKKEPRSRSRTPPRDDRRSGYERPEQDERRRRDRGESSSTNTRERPRDPVRERDWNNFFNPKSEMSKQAVVKREKDEVERKEILGEFGKKEDNESPPKEKEQPNFGLSGKLTEETNSFRGVVIKYSEPPEARKPNKIRWRLYPFKGQEALPVMYVHRQSAYLLGRERKIADIPVDHPSCSKQHAVLQYRLVPYVRTDGSKGRRIKPYIIDLESANGTYVNGNKIDPKRYVELFEKDVLKFGFSSREYVLLHDESKVVEDDSPGLTPD